VRAAAAAGRVVRADCRQDGIETRTVSARHSERSPLRSIRNRTHERYLKTPVKYRRPEHGSKATAYG
jgi:hypothetical protein